MGLLLATQTTNTKEELNYHWLLKEKEEEITNTQIFTDYK